MTKEEKTYTLPEWLAEKDREILASLQEKDMTVEEWLDEFARRHTAVIREFNKRVMELNFPHAE